MRPNLNYLFLIPAGIILLLALIGDRNIFDLYQLRQKESGLYKKQIKLEKKLRQVKSRLKELENSDVALEESARVELGLSKPGEVIYVVKPQSR